MDERSGRSDATVELMQGVRVGHAVDETVHSGVTVILPDAPAVAGYHIMGGAPGTRDTELLAPENTVERVDAIVFAGGSAYGLDAAGGVQGWLREQGRGYPAPPHRIPIVPCAILFDLRGGGNKDWGRFSPYRDLGYLAVSNAASMSPLGNVGAAVGARTATTPGGLGIATEKVAGCEVTAIVAVNAFGSPLIGRSRHFWAAPFEVGNEFGGYGLPSVWPVDALEVRTKADYHEHTNTTLGCVITNARLNTMQAKRLAVMAHDGFARALYPVHTPADGDLIFAMSTGHIEVDASAMIHLGTAAARATSRAIAIGIYNAIQQETE